jgi:hypothetical protein
MHDLAADADDPAREAWRRHQPRSRRNAQADGSTVSIFKTDRAAPDRIGPAEPWVDAAPFVVTRRIETPTTHRHRAGVRRIDDAS